MLFRSEFHFVLTKEFDQYRFEKTRMMRFLILKEEDKEGGCRQRRSQERATE